MDSARAISKVVWSGPNKSQCFSVSAKVYKLCGDWSWKLPDIFEKRSLQEKNFKVKTTRSVFARISDFLDSHKRLIIEKVLLHTHPGRS